MKKKEIYENGSSLPRLGKGKYSKILITEELWKEAIANNPDYKEMSYKEFQRIWKAIADSFKDTVINNPLGVKAPFFMGEWKIQYLPYRLEVIDHASSNELGEQIPFLNLHTKGKVCKLMWERRNARRYNRVLDLYAFEALQQGFRDEVAKAIMKNPERYRVTRLKSMNK